VSGRFGREAEVTKMARGGVIATEVQRETDAHLALPGGSLISRLGDGLRGLVRPRSLKVEERSIDAAESRRGKGKNPMTTCSSMDAGVTGGLSLLFGDSEDLLQE